MNIFSVHGWTKRWICLYKIFIEAPVMLAFILLLGCNSPTITPNITSIITPDQQSEARPQSPGLAMVGTIVSPAIEASVVPSEVPTFGVEIVQSTLYRTSESNPNNEFIGIVKNTGEKPISTKAEVTLLDENDNVVFSRTMGTVYEVILPGETSSVNFALGDSSNWVNYTAIITNTHTANPSSDDSDAEGFVVDPQFYRDFTISNVQYSKDCEYSPDGCVIGQIRNSGKVPVGCPGVNVVVLDDKQNLIGVTWGGNNRSFVIDKWNELIEKVKNNELVPNAQFKPFMPDETSTFTVPVKLFTTDKPENFLIFPRWNWGGCPWFG
jgi:hypothetical protein